MCVNSYRDFDTSQSKEREGERERGGGRRFYRERPRIFARGIEFAAVDVCFRSVAHRQGARFIRADGGKGEGEKKKRKKREEARG